MPVRLVTFPSTIQLNAKKLLVNLDISILLVLEALPVIPFATIARVVLQKGLNFGLITALLLIGYAKKVNENEIVYIL